VQFRECYLGIIERNGAIGENLHLHRARQVRIANHKLTCRRVEADTEHGL